MAYSLLGGQSLDIQPQFAAGGGGAAPAGGGFLSGAMPIAGAVTSIIGGISSAMAAYAQADSTKSSLQFQADMAKINARMAENTAQSIMDAGQKQNAALTMRYGQIKGSQKASQGARGIAGGVGSAAEELASTDIIKTLDSITINANTVRSAWAARGHGVNYSNQAALASASASSISPFGAAATSMLSSATTVASRWYKSQKTIRAGGTDLEALFAGLGG